MRPSFSYAQAILSTCRCRVCVGSRHRVAQGSHATIRRSVKHGPPTTFIFSALFTVAAAADARVKSERREELNQAIDDAERSLRELDSSDLRLRSEEWSGQYSTEMASTESTYLDKGQDEREIKAVVDDAPWRLSPPILSQTDQHAFVNAILSFLDPIKPDLPQLWARNLGLHRGSMFTSDKEKAAKVEKWTPKKLRILELSLAKLVAELSLGALALKGDYEERKERVRELTTVVDVMSKRLASIHTKDPWDVDDIIPPSYPRYWPDPSRSWDDDLELKESIVAVMDKVANHEIQLTEALEDISHNLLVAPQPPNNQTYSILIDRLSRAQCYDLADKALVSMLESHRRPDEDCVVHILDHFRRKGDGHHFKLFRLKARGFMGGLINPYWAYDNYEDSPLATARYRRHVAGLHPTGSLYSSLIYGHLSFNRMSKAMRVFYEIENTAIELPIAVLAKLMGQLVREKKYRNIQAERVWHKILAQIDHNITDVSNLDRIGSLEACRYAMHMYQRDRNRVEFERVYRLSQRLSPGFEYELDFRGLQDTTKELEDLIQQRRTLEEQVEHSRLRVVELDMKVLALWFIFRSGHTLNAIREAYLRLGEQRDYVRWAVSRITLGQDVWMPANWNVTFGKREHGRWRFDLAFTGAPDPVMEATWADGIE